MKILKTIEVDVPARGCPFCGENDESKFDICATLQSMLVMCKTCGARGPKSFTEAEAINTWNVRGGNNA